MIEPVIATALILSILALIAYYLQPQQPHHQRHYYHQIRRARVMAEPQRRGRGGGRERGEEIGGGGEGEVYERGNEEGEGEGEGRGAVEMGVRELGMIGSRLVRDELGLEDGVDVGDEKRLRAKETGECYRRDTDGANAVLDLISEGISVQGSDTLANTTPQGPSRPIISLTIPDSDITSTILPSHDTEHGVIPEVCYSNTLDQQRRQRVRFDEALRMHSYGGSQYVGRVVDEDAERRAVMKMEREDD